MVGREEREPEGLSAKSKRAVQEKVKKNGEGGSNRQERGGALGEQKVPDVQAWLHAAGSRRGEGLGGNELSGGR